MTREHQAKPKTPSVRAPDKSLFFNKSKTHDRKNTGKPVAIANRFAQCADIPQSIHQVESAEHRPA